MKTTNTNYSSLVSRLRNLYEEGIDPVKRTQRATGQIEKGSKVIMDPKSSEEDKNRASFIQRRAVGRLGQINNPTKISPANAAGRRVAAGDARLAAIRSRKPKVDDSTQPSLVSIIRKRIEEKRANVSENRFSKPPRRGRVDTGKWERNGSGRGLLPPKNKEKGGNGGTSKSDDGVDAYKDNREEMGGPRTT